jgi:hypothetical protein
LKELEAGAGKGLPEAIEEVEKRFGIKFKGFRMLTFCAVCLKAYRNLIFLNSIEKYVDSIASSGNYAVVGFFVPNDMEMLKLTDYRVVVYPICKSCIAKFNPEDIVKIVERNLQLVFRLAKPVKVGKPEDAVRMLEAGSPLVVETEDGRLILIIPEELVSEVTLERVLSGEFLGGRVPSEVYVCKKKGGRLKFYRVRVKVT